LSYDFDADDAIISIFDIDIFRFVIFAAAFNMPQLRLLRYFHFMLLFDAFAFRLFIDEARFDTPFSLMPSPLSPLMMFHATRRRFAC